MFDMVFMNWELKLSNLKNEVLSNAYFELPNDTRIERINMYGYTNEFYLVQ